jgi:hypothetical protein
MSLWTNLDKSKKNIEPIFFENIRNATGYALDMKYYLQNRNLQINRLDKNSCQRRAEDIFDPTSVFAELKLYDCDSYIDVDSHCYLIQTLIRSLFSYYDLKLIKDDLRESGSNKQLNEMHILTLLSQYMDTIESDKKLTPSAYARKYASIYVDPSVFKDFKRDREDFLQEIKDYETAMPKLKQFGNWYDKLKYLAIDHRHEETYKAIKNIYKYSANTLLELIGLFGYLCGVDDSFVTEEVNVGNNTFKIASKCIEKILHFSDKLKEIPELNKIFNTIKFGGNTIASILESTTNTCIHGVGYNSMRFYLSFYHYLQLHKERILKEALTVKEIMNDLDALNADNISGILSVNNKRFSIIIDMLDEPFDTTQYLINQASLVNNLDQLDELQRALQLDAEATVKAAEAAAKEAATQVFNAFGAPADPADPADPTAAITEADKLDNHLANLAGAPEAPEAIIKIYKTLIAVSKKPAEPAAKPTEEQIKKIALGLIKCKLAYDTIIYKSNDVLKSIAEARYYGIKYIESKEASLINTIKEKTRQVIASIKLQSIPLDTPELVDIFSNVTQLAPFLIVAPKKIQEATQFKYLTCSRLDADNSKSLVDRPFAIRYLITAFKDLPLKSNECSHIGTLRVDNNNVNNIEACHNNNKQVQFSNMPYNTRANAQVYTETFEGASSYDIVKQLLSIPATFQKHRTKMFDSYVNYCLNLCKIMSTKSGGIVDFLKTQKYYNIISCEEENFIPKYFCAIKDVKDDKDDKDEKLVMTDENMIHTDTNFTYTDNILDFTDLSYNASGAITNPYNPAQDLTRCYHEAKLVVKMLKRSKFENYIIYKPGGTDILRIAEDFNSFCGYYYLLQGQACDFQNLLNTSIKINTGEKYLNAVNILTVDFENIDQYNNESYDYYLDLLKDTMHNIIIYASLVLDIEEYKYDSLATAKKKPNSAEDDYTRPIYSNDNEYMMSMKSMYAIYAKLKRNKKLYVLTENIGSTHAYIKNILIPAWALLVKRIINFVTCNMSSSLFNVKYHYKELLDEYYFLKELGTHYSTGDTKLDDPENINELIEAWNTVSKCNAIILEKYAPETDSGTMRESVAIAQEYISKLWLVEKQECKVQVLKSFIDKALKLPLSPIPTEFREFLRSGDFTVMAAGNFNDFLTKYFALEEILDEF